MACYCTRQDDLQDVQATILGRTALPCKVCKLVLALTPHGRSDCAQQAITVLIVPVVDDVLHGVGIRHRQALEEVALVGCDSVIYALHCRLKLLDVSTNPRVSHARTCNWGPQATYCLCVALQVKEKALEGWLHGEERGQERASPTTNVTH